MVDHEVLNAKQHEREAQIIAQAGKPAAVTIATNMAGRGTDIVLGGNVAMELEALGDDQAERTQLIETEWQGRHQQVVEAGGLYVLGTERNESSSNLTPEAQRVVEAHAQYLTGNPGMAVVLEGHADERGTREYNLALGERRANAVSEIFQAMGVAPDAIRTISYGEERPISMGQNESLRLSLTTAFLPGPNP